MPRRLRACLSIEEAIGTLRVRGAYKRTIRETVWALGFGLQGCWDSRRWGRSLGLSRFVFEVGAIEPRQQLLGAVVGVHDHLARAAIQRNLLGLGFRVWGF